MLPPHILAMKKSSLQSAAYAADEAYRQDMARRGASDPFGPDDEGWVAVASLVGHAAAHVSEVVDADAMLSEACDLAEAILAAEVARATPMHTVWDGTGHPRSVAIAHLAQRIEDAGALHLAAMLYGALPVADVLFPAVDRGRVKVFHARVLRKLGRIDEAAALYDEAMKIGRRTGDRALQARVSIGYAAIAQGRGDYVEVRRHSLRAARIARHHDLPRILAMAYLGLMISAQKAGDHSAALVHGWALFQLSTDNDLTRDEALTNVGQLLMELGDCEAARSAFAAVLSRPQPARIGLPALGGLALAAVGLRDGDTLTWATMQLLREVDRVNQPYEIAHALTECAIALFSAGRVEQAENCRSRAIPIARQFGFDELLGRAVHAHDAGPNATAATAANAANAAKAATVDPAATANRVTVATSHASHASHSSPTSDAAGATTGLTFVTAATATPSIASATTSSTSPSISTSTISAIAPPGAQLLGSRARVIARKVQALAPDHLPDHVHIRVVA